MNYTHVSSQLIKILLSLTFMLSLSLGFAQKMEMHSESPEAIRLMNEAFENMGHNMELFGQNVAKAVELDPNMVVAIFFESLNPDKTMDEVGALMKRVQAYKGETSEGEKILIEMSTHFGEENYNPFENMVKLAEAYPNDARMHLVAGAAYTYGRMADKGIPHLEKVLEMGALSGAYNMLGYAYMSLGKMDEAKANFERYMEAAPNFWNPHDSMGDYLMAVKDYAAAATHFQKAADLHPEFPEHAEKAKKALELANQ